MKTKLTIRNCESTFRFQCLKTWSELSPTATIDVRHCGICDCDVFLCKTDEETIQVRGRRLIVKVANMPSGR